MSAPEIDGLVNRIADLERRLARMEGAPNLVGAIPPGGTIASYDASGIQQVVFGEIDPTTGKSGITIGVNDPVPALQVDDVNGITYPQIPIIFREEPTTSITLSSFSEYSHATVVGIAHKGVYVNLVASTDVGTVGEVRLLRTGTGAVTSNAVSVPSNSFLLTVEFWLLHGATLGGTAQFVLQARRVSGAGQFIVNDPKYAALVGPQHCSTTGLFVP